MTNGTTSGPGGPDSQIRTNRQTQTTSDSTGPQSGDGKTGGEKSKFGKFMSDVGDAVLKTVADVAPVVPGGELIKDAANGLRGLSDGAPAGLGSGSMRGDQLDKMWKMQKQNQVHNMQYLELQQEMQRDNRHFKTMSNLMKVRHDTAKAAIDNMRA